MECLSEHIVSILAQASVHVNSCRPLRTNDQSSVSTTKLRLHSQAGVGDSLNSGCQIGGRSCSKFEVSLSETLTLSISLSLLSTNKREVWLKCDRRRDSLIVQQSHLSLVSSTSCYSAYTGRTLLIINLNKCTPCQPLLLQNWRSLCRWGLVID